MLRLGQGLYAIVDVDAVMRTGLAVLEFADAVLAARPAVLQLRAKARGAADTLDLLRALRKRCNEAGTLLFANDRPDLAVLAGCDGVHVGQTDLSVSEVRRFEPGLAVGVSTHDAAQLAAALDQRPDYVAFGPVFETASKERPDPMVGLDGLVRAGERTRAAAVPLVAIGGIDLERAPSVRAHADLVAMIGALTGPEAAVVTARARALQHACR